MSDGEWVEEISAGAEAAEDFSRTEQMEDLDRVCTGAFSDVGKRANQQDAARVSESYTYAASRRMIAVLCDGMGGLAGGERASGYCVEKMYEVFNGVSAEKDVPRFYGMIVEALDRQVKDMTDETGQPLGAGTTLVSVIVEDGKLYRASVGDSRIYIINDVSILCLTQDHNYSMILNEQVRRGLITKQAAQEHPKREALISFIGMGGVRCADIPEKPFLLRDGDRVLLCSDGLYRTLSESEMASIVRSAEDDMEAAARMLVQRAVGKGKSNQDNTTAIVIKYLAV